MSVLADNWVNVGTAEDILKDKGHIMLVVKDGNGQRCGFVEAWFDEETGKENAVVVYTNKMTKEFSALWIACHEWDWNYYDMFEAVSFDPI